jgi:peptidoglycan/LPS O-acetylase OafA/YrhL
LSEGGSAAVRPRAAGEARAGKSRVAFVDMGRAIAALLIVYSHVDELLLRENLHRGSWLTDLIDGAVRPLGLDKDAIGYLSVPFFFLVSGFVVPPMAQKIGSARFAVKFVCRLVPLLVFAVGVSAAVLAAGGRTLTTGPVHVSASTVLQNVVLVNFLHKPVVALVGVSWSLLPEVTFYLLLIALIPVHRKMPWLAIAIELEFVFVVLMLRGALGVDFRDFAANTAYVTLAIIGQAAFSAWQRKIPYWLGGLFAALAFALYSWATTMNIDPDYVLPFRPVLYSVLLFAAGLVAERWLRQRAIWTALSERTYALYLLHGVAAFPVMFALYDVVPLWLNALIAIAATFLLVELAYRFVDRPLNNLGRRWSSSKVAAAAGVPDALRGAAPAAAEPDVEDEAEDWDDEYDEDYDDEWDEDGDDGDDEDWTDTTLPPVPAPRLTGPVTCGVLPVTFLPNRATGRPFEASEGVSGPPRAARRAPAPDPTWTRAPAPDPADRPDREEETADVAADHRAGSGRRAVPHPAGDHPRPPRATGRHALRPGVTGGVSAAALTGALRAQLPRRGATSPDS